MPPNRRTDSAMSRASIAKRKTNGHPAIASLAILLLFLGTWEVLAWAFFRDSGLLPTPHAVLRAFFVDIPPRSLVNDCAASLGRVGVGFLTAVIVGVVSGVLSGAFPRVGSHFATLVEFFRPISPIAWIPLAILWFGVGERSSYFIIFIAAFFPIFTNSFAGARSVSSVHITVARSLKAPWPVFLRHVLLPSALPQIVTGVRIGLGIAWMAVIASEMVAAQSGLGYMIQINRLLMLSDRVVAGMVVIGLIGYVMNHLAVLLGEVLTPWTHLSE